MGYAIWKRIYRKIQLIQSTFGVLSKKRKEMIIISHVGEKRKETTVFSHPLVGIGKMQIKLDRDLGVISFSSFEF